MAKKTPGSYNLSNASVMQTMVLDDLCVDWDYQRPLVKPYCRKIAVAGIFDRDAVRPPILNTRANGYTYIIDGQQTRHILSLMNIREWDCIRFTGKTPVQEADLFYKYNASPRTIQGWIKFRAAHMAGRGSHVNIVNTIHDNRLTCKLDAHANIIDFHQAQILLQEYGRGLPHFQRLIRVLANGWRLAKDNPHLQPAVKKTEMIRAFSDFIAHTTEKDDRRIIAALRREENDSGKVLTDATRKAGACQKIRSIEYFIKGELFERCLSRAA